MPQPLRYNAGSPVMTATYSHEEIVRWDMFLDEEYEAEVTRVQSNIQRQANINDDPFSIDNISRMRTM